MSAETFKNGAKLVNIRVKLISFVKEYIFYNILFISCSCSTSPPGLECSGSTTNLWDLEVNSTPFDIECKKSKNIFYFQFSFYDVRKHLETPFFWLGEHFEIPPPSSTYSILKLYENVNLRSNGSIGIASVDVGSLEPTITQCAQKILNKVVKPFNQTFTRISWPSQFSHYGQNWISYPSCWWSLLCPLN